MGAEANRENRERDVQMKNILGFHGDLYLLKLVDKLSEYVDTFIETGTNIGITLNYFANKNPMINCLSCEPYRDYYRKAKKLTSNCKNVSLFNESSQRFLKRLYKNRSLLFGKTILFWLDAHGHGFNWPLREEISFITSNFKKCFILIDDFKVPYNRKFNYNKYGKQECSFAYIKNSINPKTNFNLYYPNYKEHTSKHHPLVGWGLLQVGMFEKLNKTVISNKKSIIKRSNK